jgi:hypothetical protein
MQKILEKIQKIQSVAEREWLAGKLEKLIAKQR